MNQKQNKYDFSWGNPYFLLEVLDRVYKPLALAPTVKDMIYGPYEGMPELIKETHKVIFELTGLSYKHILITNGASNAINSVLRHFKSRGGTTVHTSKYGYPSYEEMIKRAGLLRVRDLNSVPVRINLETNQYIRLIDSPSNPVGDHYTGGNPDMDIWDSVYHNKIYTNNAAIQPQHLIHIGSYSKLLGVAGARVGYIATDDTLLYEALVQESRNDLTGPSRPSQKFILDILDKVDLDVFMKLGNIDLCRNKEEFLKLEYLFDGQPVNEIGMFYSPKADTKAVDILEKAGIDFVRLDSETIRLSMGQTGEITKAGIQAVLKQDGKRQGP